MTKINPKDNVRMSGRKIAPDQSGFDPVLTMGNPVGWHITPEQVERAVEARKTAKARRMASEGARAKPKPTIPPVPWEDPEV